MAQRDRDAELVQKFEEELMEKATPVESNSGTAFTTYLKLADFFPKHNYGELYEEEGYWEALPLLGSDTTELLVDFFLDNTAPGMSWAWNLRSFRLGDRGYLMLWAEPDVEAGEPVLGFWEPFDDQDAFESCFVAAYAQNVDPIITAPQLMLGDRVSKALMTNALLQGLEGENAELLLGYMDIEERNPSKVTREMVADYVERATKG